MRPKITVTLVLFITLLTTSVVSAGPPVHQVSGGGKTVLEDGTFETYGFVAKVDGEGHVSGRGVLHVHDPLNGQIFFHHETYCLSVDANTAWVSGIVTKSNAPDVFPVGFDFTVQLQDNGEGKQAAPDLQSYGFPTAMLPDLGLGNDCHDQGDFFAFGAFEWQNGNIQIR